MADYKVKQVNASRMSIEAKIGELIEKYTGDGWNYELVETIESNGSTVGLVFRKDDEE